MHVAHLLHQTSNANSEMKLPVVIEAEPIFRLCCCELKGECCILLISISLTWKNRKQQQRSPVWQYLEK